MYSIIAPSQLHMGPDSLSALKGILAAYPTGKILLVTDEGIRKSGILDRVLRAAEVDPGRLDVFDRVEANPEIPLMEECGRIVAEGAPFCRILP